MLRGINVGKLVRLKGGPEHCNFLANRTDRLVVKRVQNLLGRDVVIALVERFCYFNIHGKIGQLVLNDLGYLDDFMVLETEIEGSAIDHPGIKTYEKAVQIYHVGHPHVWTALIPSVHGDATFFHGFGGWFVSGQARTGAW